MKIAALFVLTCAAASAHDIITTPITWGLEISTIVSKHCASCHQPKGQAFSLLTYQDARPWAVAIREEVLKRTMPPWGAVKGFGDFSNDSSLTPEEIELIVKWTEGGVPEGAEKTLKSHAPERYAPRPKGSLRVSGTQLLTHSFRLGALFPEKTPPGAEFKITAELPDGTIEPLLWLKDYQQKFSHGFWLRTPITLPPGTTIRGVPNDAKVLLLPPSNK